MDVVRRVALKGRALHVGGALSSPGRPHTPSLARSPPAAQAALHMGRGREGGRHQQAWWRAADAFGCSAAAQMLHGWSPRRARPRCRRPINRSVTVRSSQLTVPQAGRTCVEVVAPVAHHVLVPAREGGQWRTGVGRQRRARGRAGGQLIGWAGKAPAAVPPPSIHYHHHHHHTKRHSHPCCTSPGHCRASSFPPCLLLQHHPTLLSFLATLALHSHVHVARRPLPVANAQRLAHILLHTRRGRGVGSVRQLATHSPKRRAHR